MKFDQILKDGLDKNVLIHRGLTMFFRIFCWLLWCDAAKMTKLFENLECEIYIFSIRVKQNERTAMSVHNFKNTGFSVTQRF